MSVTSLSLLLFVILARRVDFFAAVFGVASGGVTLGHKELLAEPAVYLAVQCNEQGRVDVRRDTVPGSGERIAYGRAHHRVEIDVGGERERLQHNVVIQSHDRYGEERPVPVGQRLHVVDAAESHQVERRHEHEKVMDVVGDDLERKLQHS